MIPYDRLTPSLKWVVEDVNVKVVDLRVRVTQMVTFPNGCVS